MARIVIVEEDEDIRQLACELLEARGWEVICCPADGEQVRHAAPDLVILDVFRDVPGSGWETLRGLQADCRSRHIPVIIWSAAQEAVRRQEAWLVEHGIVAVEKPFDIDDLYRAIEVALARAS